MSRMQMAKRARTGGASGVEGVEDMVWRVNSGGLSNCMHFGWGFRWVRGVAVRRGGRPDYTKLPSLRFGFGIGEF